MLYIIIYIVLFFIYLKNYNFVFVYLQFCEIIFTPSVRGCVGPIIDTLLNYVGHVKLCSRITELLDRNKDWAHIKERSGKSILYNILIC